MIALLLAADESSAGYRAGQVIGRVAVLAGIVALLVYGARALLRRHRRARLLAEASVWRLPPAWYPDPGGSATKRWWDGVNWTERTTGSSSAVSPDWEPPAQRAPAPPA